MVEMLHVGRKDSVKAKKYIPLVLFVIMGVTGLVIALYPAISNFLQEREQEQLVNEYRDQVAAMEQEMYDKLFAETEEYNRRLYEENIDFISIEGERSKLEAEGLYYQRLLRVEENAIMGYLIIDKLDICLPIDYGTEEEVLQKRVGHMEGTSLPIGGESTHAVLFGHRGLPSAKLFTDLDQMEIGDTFEIYVLNRRLVYEVDQILVVTPGTTENLEIEEGKDYVTLVTCTPYAVNTHRLLVRGVRVDGSK